MVSIEDNHFIKRLEEGKITRVMLMAHNAYHSQLRKFERIYSNFKVYTFGSSTAYARMRKDDIPKDCDFIILDGSDYYSEEEFYETKKIATKIAKNNNKRVSIGYVYWIPIDERTNSNISSAIKISSIKNDNENEQIIPILYNYDLLSLADILIKTHNELENQRILQKT